MARISSWIRAGVASALKAKTSGEPADPPEKVPIAVLLTDTASPDVVTIAVLMIPKMSSGRVTLKARVSEPPSKSALSTSARVAAGLDVEGKEAVPFGPGARVVQEVGRGRRVVDWLDVYRRSDGQGRDIVVRTDVRAGIDQLGDGDDAVGVGRRLAGIAVAQRVDKRLHLRRAQARAGEAQCRDRA